MATIRTTEPHDPIVTTALLAREATAGGRTTDPSPRQGHDR